MAGNTLHCCCDTEDRNCGRRGANDNKAMQAAVLRHSEAILEQDNTVVHEQGGRGQVNTQGEADLLLLGKADGHARCQS